MLSDPQYPESEQHSPKTEPRQVWPPPVAPHAPSTDTGAEGEVAGAEEESVLRLAVEETSATDAESELGGLVDDTAAEDDKLVLGPILEATDVERD
jgi:hypothetical protein